jgi:hypothetical protein
LLLLLLPVRLIGKAPERALPTVWLGG